jgi:hypothetical protein
MAEKNVSSVSVIQRHIWTTALSSALTQIQCSIGTRTPAELTKDALSILWLPLVRKLLAARMAERKG